MDFRQIEAFVSAVDSRSFSAAAEKLYLSQPTISAHVHSLEKELHVQLIKRTTKEFEVTEDGRRLYEYASNILHMRQKAIKELSAQYKKEIHIGASSVPGQGILPMMLAEYHKAAPEIRFDILHADSMDVIQKVADGLLDVGLVGTIADVECKFIPFATDELVIIAPNTPHYQHLFETEAPLAALMEEPILLRTGDSGTMLETEHFLADLNIRVDDLNVIARINSNEVLQRCVMRGLGISIISHRMVERFAQRGELLVFTLGEQKLLRNLYIVYRENSYLSKSAEKFIAFLKKYSQ